MTTAYHFEDTRKIDCPRCGQNVLVSTSGTWYYIMTHKHQDGEQCDASLQFVAREAAS